MALRRLPGTWASAGRVCEMEARGATTSCSHGAWSALITSPVYFLLPKPAEKAPVIKIKQVARAIWTQSIHFIESKHSYTEESLVAFLSKTDRNFHSVLGEEKYPIKHMDKEQILMFSGIAFARTFLFIYFRSPSSLLHPSISLILMGLTYIF